MMAELDQQADSLPRVLGPYRLVRLLGEGSSGRVFLAERTAFAQRVAVKCFYSGFLAAGAGADPSRERDLLTRLDHPNIVRLIDHNIAADGSEYLVMEYVDGLPLGRFADTHKLTLDARIRLFLPVLDAVDYAHRHLIVHRDLKPANVLVGRDPASDVTPASEVAQTGDVAEAGGRGQPKLLDFGSAAGLGAETASLTLAYASPEQRLGAPATVASDVYALGLMARELLAGVPPGRDPGLSARSACRDSNAAQAIAEARSTTLDRLLRELAGDLDAIVGKALAYEPERRYFSVADMRGDFERHLAGLPITARRTGGAERAWLWVGRHRLAAAMSALLAVVIAGSAAGVTVKAAEAAHQRRVAETRLGYLVRLNGSLEGELYGSVASLPGSEAARKSLIDGATATLDSVSRSHVQNPRLALELAMQFEQLARLQLAQGAQAEARTDAAKGLAVLAETRRSADAQAEAARLRELAGSGR